MSETPLDRTKLYSTLRRLHAAGRAVVPASELAGLLEESLDRVIALAKTPDAPSPEFVLMADAAFLPKQPRWNDPVCRLFARGSQPSATDHPA